MMGLVPRLLRLTAAIVFGLLVVSVVASLTAANTVPASRAGDSSRSATPDTLKPSACSGITLSAKVSGAGTFGGTNADELISGSAGVDTISARNGNDCVLGGAGNDDLNGGPGTDVCIGGAGTNTFAACETQL